jgi:hypothetical protein
LTHSSQSRTGKRTSGRSRSRLERLVLGVDEQAQPAVPDPTKPGDGRRLPRHQGRQVVVLEPADERRDFVCRLRWPASAQDLTDWVHVDKEEFEEEC